jgi:hypothetical protein
MARKLVWIENQNFQGFGCSQCDWVFKPSGVLVGESLDKMKQDYEVQRDKEFAAHVCVSPCRERRIGRAWERALPCSTDSQAPPARGGFGARRERDSRSGTEPRNEVPLGTDGTLGEKSHAVSEQGSVRGKRR